MTEKPKDADETDDVFHDFETPNFDNLELPKFDDVEIPNFDDFPNLDDDFFKTPELPDLEPIDPSLFEPINDSLFDNLPSLDFDFATTPSEPLPPTDPSLTAADAATWMKEEVERTGHLDQEHAASHVRRHFGERFIRLNENGNPAFTPEVLKEFLKLTKHTVVWCKRERYWRKRHQGDPPTREVPC